LERARRGSGKKNPGWQISLTRQRIQKIYEGVALTREFTVRASRIFFFQFSRP